MFDQEKLDVYQLELQFIEWSTDLLAELKAHGAPARTASDQLDRAALSSLLNTAEGNGKRQRQVRVRYFDDARGSVSECAACLDALVAKRLCTPERVHDGKLMLMRIGKMLTRLVTLFSEPDSVREVGDQYQLESPD